jgi:hypothetical protein
MYSFNVLLTTIGREELKTKTLPSLVNQLNENDFLTIVSDANHSIVRDILNEFSFKCVVNHVANPVALGHWGHGSRNKYQNLLLGDFIMNADDDNRYVDGAFDFIRSVVSENKMYIFRVQIDSIVVWKDPDVRMGNIDTACAVIPNTRTLPDWDLVYGGDGYFYEKLSRQIPYEFVDYIIYKMRDTP